MPKGTRKTSNAKRVNKAYITTDSKGRDKVQGKGAARALVGDQGVAKTDAAYQSGSGKYAYSSDKQKTPTQRKTAASKAKATVKKAASKAVKDAKKKGKK